MRIALIHALKHSLVPIEDAFAELWPEATRMNLLDDSLSADLARDGALTEAMSDFSFPMSASFLKSKWEASENGALATR